MILVPKNSRFYPSKEQRELAAKRVNSFTPEKFDAYNDWFYFIHIDPVQRLIHAFGMYVGLYLFVMIFIEWSTLSWLYYILGVFFFYVLGIISHQIYDKGQAKSEPKYFLPTFMVVIKFNLQTTFGFYDKGLRDFVKKYPFVKEAYELEEIPRSQLLSHLLKS